MESTQTLTATIKSFPDGHKEIKDLVVAAPVAVAPMNEEGAGAGEGANDNNAAPVVAPGDGDVAAPVVAPGAAPGDNANHGGRRRKSAKRANKKRRSTKKSKGGRKSKRTYKR